VSRSAKRWIYRVIGAVIGAVLGYIAAGYMN